MGRRPSRCPKSSSLTPPPHPGDRKDQVELHEPSPRQSVSPQGGPRHLRAAPSRLKGKEKRGGWPQGGVRAAAGGFGHWCREMWHLLGNLRTRLSHLSPLGKRWREKGMVRAEETGWDTLPRCPLRGVCLW